MKAIILLLSILIVPIGIAPAVADIVSNNVTEIYTWVDAKGIRHYSNHTQPGEAEIFIKTITPNDIKDEHVNDHAIRIASENRQDADDDHERYQDDEIASKLEAKLLEQLEMTQKKIKRLEEKLNETNNRIENQNGPPGGSENIATSTPYPSDINHRQNNQSTRYIIKSYGHRRPAHRWPNGHHSTIHRHAPGAAIYGHDNRYTQRPSKHRIKAYYNDLNRQTEFKQKTKTKKQSSLKRMSHRSRSWGVFSTRSQLRKSRSAASGSTAYGNIK